MMEAGWGLATKLVYTSVLCTLAYCRTAGQPSSAAKTKNKVCLMPILSQSWHSSRQAGSLIPKLDSLGMGTRPEQASAVTTGGQMCDVCSSVLLQAKLTPQERLKKRMQAQLSKQCTSAISSNTNNHISWFKIKSA